MKRFINWLIGKNSSKKATGNPSLARTGAHLRQTSSQLRRTGSSTAARPLKSKPAAVRRLHDIVELDPNVPGHIEDNGPGKNVFVRNRYVREDSGTHETLKILDDSVVDTDDAGGIDPYNTGQFDRSRNWDRRTK